MAGELHYYMKDLYPNMGFMDTTLSTVADTDDQNAMVDDQDLAEKYNVKENPVQTKKIWMAVLAVIAVMFFLGVIKS